MFDDGRFGHRALGEYHQVRLVLPYQLTYRPDGRSASNVPEKQSQLTHVLSLTYVSTVQVSSGSDSAASTLPPSSAASSPSP